MTGDVDVPYRVLSDFEFQGTGLVGPSISQLDGPTNTSGLGIKFIPLNREAKSLSPAELRQNYLSPTIRQVFALPTSYSPVGTATVYLRSEYMVAVKRHQLGQCKVSVFGRMDAGKAGIVVDSVKTMQSKVDADEFGSWATYIVTSIAVITFHGKPNRFELYQDTVFSEQLSTPSGEIKANFPAFSYWVRSELSILLSQLTPETEMWEDYSDSEGESSDSSSACDSWDLAAT